MKFVLPVSVLLLASSCRLFGQAVPPNYTLLFSDDFTGPALDSSKWNYRTDTKDLSAQISGSISVSSGDMDINLAKQKFGGASYTGGGIVSKDTFRYGYYQIAAQTTANPGWHTSFWVFPGNGTTTYTYAAHTEIDDFEISSDSPSTISMGYFVWSKGLTGLEAHVATTRTNLALVRRLGFITMALSGLNQG